jgi:A/G-specific adenine glycosylase
LKEAISAVWPEKRSGDFAQALMDLGAIVCTPKNPKCGACPLCAHCEGRKKGLAECLPRKAEKAERPTRCGVAYALVNAKGEMLFERRPEKGLLGGCLGLPCTEWTEAIPHPHAGEGGAKRRARAAALESSRRRRITEFPLTPDPPLVNGRGERFAAIAWRRAGTVAHTFTHFRLELDVMTAEAPKSFKVTDGRQWLRPEEARLPTVMKKAVERAIGGRGG